MNSQSENQEQIRNQIKSYFFPELPDKPIAQWIFAAVLWILALFPFLGWFLITPIASWFTNREDGAIKKYSKKSKWRKQLLENYKMTEEELPPPPTAKEIDDFLRQDFNQIIQRALQKLDLVDSQLVRSPLVIYGPLFWKTYGISDDEIIVKTGDDRILRFSCYQLVVVCLSEDRIAAYSCDYNFLRGSFLNDKATEYLYQDIVSIETEEISTNYTLRSGQVMRRAQIFRLTVPSGNNIQVVVGSPEIKDLFDGKLKENNHEESVKAIREMLRSKKTQPVNKIP